MKRIKCVVKNPSCGGPRARSGTVCWDCALEWERLVRDGIAKPRKGLYPDAEDLAKEKR